MVRCGTKKNPSDLGTKILEKEAMTRCICNRPCSAPKSAIAAVLALMSCASEVIIASIEGDDLAQEEKAMAWRRGRLVWSPRSRLVLWQEEPLL